jgi:TetR/AcrR family transcriptional repressor of nem operon
MKDKVNAQKATSAKEDMNFFMTGKIAGIFGQCKSMALCAKIYFVPISTKYYLYLLMAGRPSIFDEEKVLEKAREIFWTRGYEATSLDQLLEVMGLGKSSFYHAFGSKKELFEKIMDRFVNDAIHRLASDLPSHPQPIERIREFFRGIANSPSQLHRKGCFMGNTVVELINTEHSLSTRAAKKLERLENLFRTYIESAQQSGQLQTKEDPGVLALYLLTVWNGLNITRRVHPDAGALAPLIELQLQVLK